MPAGKENINWLGVFEQMANPAPNFLSGFFTLKPEGLSNSDKVSWDVVRDGEDIATPIQQFKGGQKIAINKFTNKETKPPKYLPTFTVDATELKSRMPGNDPYSDAGIAFGAKLIEIMARKFRVAYPMIVRALELQAAQILTTGKLELKDIDDDVVTEIDFTAKASHLITVGTVWSNAGADPISDIAAAGDVVQQDGQTPPKRVIFGTTAYQNFLKNSIVKERLDLMYMQENVIDSALQKRGAVFHGMMQFGTYKLELWSYNKTYKHPNTLAATQYLDPTKVVVMGDEIRLDRVASRPAYLVDMDPRVAPFLPDRVTSETMGIDIVPNIELINRKELQADLEANILLIPIQIDGFACLTTE